MWPAIAGAVLGGIAGAEKDKVKTGLDLAGEGDLEKRGREGVGNSLNQLTDFTNAGPGQGDVARAYTGNLGFADMLKQYSQGGFLPSESDFATANKFAGQAFQPQQVALQQQFGQQQQRAAQMAAQMGRPVNDPIIQAKLSQEQMQGSERLQAQQGSFANQFAMSMPQQRLGYTSQLADVQNSLASQAMSNRQALLSLGSQVQNSERNFRLQSADRWQESGGGFKGALTGALGGAASFMGINNMMNGKQFNGASLDSGGGNSGSNAGAAGSFMGGMLGSNTSFGNMQPNVGSSMNFSAPTQVQGVNAAASYSFQAPQFGMRPFGPSTSTIQENWQQRQQYPRMNVNPFGGY